LRAMVGRQRSEKAEFCNLKLHSTLLKTDENGKISTASAT